MPRFIVISTNSDEQTHFVDYVSASGKQATVAIAAEARPDTQVSVAFTALELSLYLHDMIGPPMTSFRLPRKRYAGKPVRNRSDAA